MLTEEDISALMALRRDLHRRPEVSGEEAETAATVHAALLELSPDQLMTRLGGHGVAAVFEGGAPGPTAMIRCELDGLPIAEVGDVPWTSEVSGKGHLCGHDGHMAMVLGLGRLLSRQRPKRGCVALLFQPAEEDGSGARAVVADPQFSQIAPDWAFAIHNLPGVALGQVATQVGLMNPASLGLEIRLIGKTAHAAAPETGVSPGLAMATLVPALAELGAGGPMDEDYRLATVTHARLGVPSFGIAPGDAVINVTLRASSDVGLADMVASAQSLAKKVAARDGLTVRFTDCDVFAASINDPDAVAVVQAACTALGIPHGADQVPMRASEDFGVFGHQAKAAMICLGSGIDQPALHNPDFDFPDALIPVGVGLFDRIIRHLVG